MAEVNKSPASLEQRRPLSPHLQIYRPMLTMMMSITHRITGAALYFGTLLLAWYLIAASGDARGFATAQWFFSSWLGLLILFGYTLALFIHLLGGVRHAIWDTGRGFDPRGREFLAQATLFGGVALTVVVWAIGFMAR
jgi:succinate dehydrogenase / fumarate reductase cytochrome b subunit